VPAHPDSLVGKTGRVTSTIRPGRTGEVVLEVGGGNGYYLARHGDGDEEIPSGTPVVVVEQHPGRTVTVTRL
jgi:protein-L-isoaspartate O-methyltransferase